MNKFLLILLIFYLFMFYGCSSIRTTDIPYKTTLEHSFTSDRTLAIISIFPSYESVLITERSTEIFLENGFQPVPLGTIQASFPSYPTNIMSYFYTEDTLPEDELKKLEMIGSRLDTDYVLAIGSKIARNPIEQNFFGMSIIDRSKDVLVFITSVYLYRTEDNAVVGHSYAYEKIHLVVPHFIDLDFDVSTTGFEGLIEDSLEDIANRIFKEATSAN